MKNTVKINNDICIMPEDLFTFFILPIIISIIIILIGGLLNYDVSNSLLISMTILIPILLSLLILIYNMGHDLKNNVKISPKEKHDSLKLLNEIKANISFTVLISFICLILLIIWTVLSNGSYLSNFIKIPYGGTIYKVIFSFIVYIFIGINFLTLLMVLRRFYKLLDKSLE